MTEEAQKLLIAEACGIFICPHCFHEIDPKQCSCGESIDHWPDGHNSVPMGCTCGYDDAPNRKAKKPMCPDYFNDLNTRRDMIEVIVDRKLTNEFTSEFSGIWDAISIPQTMFCRYFLRTIGKWVE